MGGLFQVQVATQRLNMSVSAVSNFMSVLFPWIEFEDCQTLGCRALFMFPLKFPQNCLLKEYLTLLYIASYQRLNVGDFVSFSSTSK